MTCDFTLIHLKIKCFSLTVAGGQLHLIFFFFNWITFGCAGPLLLWKDFFPVVVSRGHSLVALLGLLTAGLLLLQSPGSQHMGFCSCGTQAYLPWGTWNLSRQGFEPVSPCVVRQIFNNWTTKGSLYLLLINRGVMVVWWHIIHLSICSCFYVIDHNWTYLYIQPV